MQFTFLLECGKLLGRKCSLDSLAVKHVKQREWSWGVKN